MADWDGSLVDDELGAMGLECLCGGLGCPECEDDGDDIYRIEDMCQECFKHESVMLGLCVMCAELNPHLL